MKGQNDIPTDNEITSERQVLKQDQNSNPPFQNEVKDIRTVAHEGIT